MSAQHSDSLQGPALKQGEGVVPDRADGSQRPEPSQPEPNRVKAEETGLAADPLAQALGQLTGEGFRPQKSDVLWSANLLQTREALSRTLTELHEERALSRELQDRLLSESRERASAEGRAAVLQERLSAREAESNLRMALSVLSSILVGAGVAEFGSSPVLAIVAILVGLALFAFAFWPRGKKS